MGIFNLFNKRSKDIVNQNGINQIFYKSGAIHEIYEKKEGLKHGLYREFHENGNIIYEISYVDGVKSGQFRDFFYDQPNLVAREGCYKSNKLNGLIKYYAKNGEVRMTMEFDEGEKLSEDIFFKIDKFFNPITDDSESKLKKSKTEKISKMDNTKTDEVNDWISIIEDEDLGQPEKPFYTLIEHKTDFFNNDKLVFSGLELIIEVWESEDCEEFFGNIYPELVAGNTRDNYETFIITNHPDYDYQELTNGLSTIAEGSSEIIAEKLSNLKRIDYNELLPIDKDDFTYFESLNSSKIVHSAFTIENKITDYNCELIGAEIYAFNTIIDCDESIKKRIDFENYVFLQNLSSEGYDNFDLPQNNSLKRDGDTIIHSSRRDAALLLNDEDKLMFENLSKVYKKEPHLLRWYTAYRDFKLPSKSEFERLNKNEIKKIKEHLELFYEFNYPAYEIIVNILRSFKVCLWDSYHEFIYDIKRFRGIHNVVDSDKHSRINSKVFNSKDSFLSYVENDRKNSEVSSFCNLEQELLNDNYISFLEKLKDIQNKYIVVQREEERLRSLKKEKEKEKNNFSEKHFDNGLKYVEEQNYQKAIEEFNLSLNFNPVRSEAYSNLSACKYELKDYDGAMSDINKAIDLDGSESIPYYMRGLIKTNFGDNTGALEDYNKCLQINPEDFDARTNRALIHTNDREYDLAINDFNYIINEDELNIKALLGRANLNQRFNKILLALKDYEKVIELNPNDHITIKDCAMLYQDYGDLEKTYYYLEKYVEINSENEEINNLLNLIKNRNPDDDNIDEDLFYFEKVIHFSAKTNFTEFAIWSCWCQKDLSGEWDYDSFEKIEFINGSFFDAKKNEISEDEFDDLYNTAIESVWSKKIINADKEKLRTAMINEIKDFKNS